MAKRGRPSTYPTGQAAEELCKRVIELGEQGLSEAEIAKEVGHPRTTLRTWAESGNWPEFTSAFARAAEMSLAWWERECRENLGNKAFNAQLWLKTVASRFRADYAERQTIEHTGPDGGPIQYQNLAEDEVDRRLHELASKLGNPVQPSETVH